MQDGLYQVIRGPGVSYGPEETLVCSAYNNREAMTYLNRAYRYLPPSLYNYADFIRTLDYGFEPPFETTTPSALDGTSGLHNYLSKGFALSANSIYRVVEQEAYYGGGLGEIDPLTSTLISALDATCLFGFTTPAGYSGDITKISVYALVYGNAKTRFRNLAGTITEGSLETIPDIFRWVHTDYEQAWNWSDINSLKAGVWLDCDYGECRSVKLRVTYSGGLTVDVYPSSTYSSSNVRRIYANPLYNSYEDGPELVYYDASFRDWPTGNNLRLSRNYSSDFHSFPVSESKINQIDVTFSYCGIDGCDEFAVYYEIGGLWHEFFYGPTGCTIKPYLFVDGGYYYGTTYTIGSTLDTLTTHTETWATNPATGVAWTYHEAQGARFGLKVERPNTTGTGGRYSVFGLIRIYALYATIYSNPSIGNTVSYRQLNIRDDTLDLTQYTQSPIKADDLSFRMPKGEFIPERTELALIKHGKMVWRGIAWTVEENQNGEETNVLAKSQQILLDYRVFPGISYVPQNKNFVDIYNITDIFSDAAPTYPAWSFNRGEEDHLRQTAFIAQYPISAFDIFSQRISNENYNVGLFFFLNSWIPSSFDANKLASTTIFSMEPIQKNENDNTYSTADTNVLPDYAAYDPPPAAVITSALTRGGLYRLAWRSNPANVVRGEFSISGSTLYTQDPVGSTHILADHALDTYIRPGTNDLGTYLLNCLYDFRGIAATCFSDFFSKIGQEVRYRYELDGYVYQDVATKIASGSATNPLMKFIHNKDNCKITKQVPAEPKPDAAIGIDRVSSNWTKQIRSWFTKVISGSSTGDELQEYLDTKIDDQEVIYDISVLEECWLLRPGDYISVELPHEGEVSIRIRQINTKSGITTIRAGKKLMSMNEQFGVWRAAKTTPRDENKIRSQAITPIPTSSLAWTQPFTVYAIDVKDDWKCLANVSWDYIMYGIVYGTAWGEETQYASIYRAYPTSIEAYIQMQGVYDQYGATIYEFQITREMVVIVYPGNIVEILTPGQYKWRKDGGDWQGPYDGLDAWHPTNYFADMGNGMEGRVIFSTATPAYMTPYSTAIAGYSASVYVVTSLDITSGKFIKLDLNGKTIPPGRYLASSDSGSLQVDISEYCSTSSTSNTVNNLTVSMVGGMAKGTYPNYYHTISGTIDQYRRIVPLEDVS